MTRSGISSKNQQCGSGMTGLRLCLQALKRLSGTCSQVVAIQGCGTHDDRFYMVMQVRHKDNTHGGQQQHYSLAERCGACSSLDVTPGHAAGGLFAQAVACNAVDRAQHSPFVNGIAVHALFDGRCALLHAAQLLGETLYDIRKQAGGRLELPTVKAVGLSTLTAIEQVHQHNMIHRDIKPANFVINPPNTAANKGAAPPGVPAAAFSLSLAVQVCAAQKLL